MFKRLALGLAIALILLGIFFIGMDILDIAEDYRLHLSIAVLNTIFISAFAALIAYFAARVFISDGSPEMLGLGGAACAFVTGILLYGWLDADLSTRVVAHDSGLFLAAIMFTGGAGLKMAGWHLTKSTPGSKLVLLFVCYSVIAAILSILTWLASRGLISFLQPAIGPIGYRSIARGGAALLYIAAALFYIRTYIRSHSDVYYWYSLGLILIAFGVVFIAQGALESRTAWSGRAAEYAGFIYLFFCVLVACRHRQPG